MKTIRAVFLANKFFKIKISMFSISFFVKRDNRNYTDSGQKFKQGLKHKIRNKNRIFKDIEQPVSIFRKNTGFKKDKFGEKFKRFRSAFFTGLENKINNDFQ